MGQDNRPASIRHSMSSPALAHGWVRYDNGWLVTTCGMAVGPGDYELLPERSPVTCITCLVKSQ